MTLAVFMAARLFSRLPPRSMALTSQGGGANPFARPGSLGVFFLYRGRHGAGPVAGQPGLVPSATPLDRAIRRFVTLELRSKTSPLGRAVTERSTRWGAIGGQGSGFHASPSHNQPGQGALSGLAFTDRRRLRNLLRQ
jgi:hypothetical protein